MKNLARTRIVSVFAATLVLFVAFGASGCATVLHGTTQKVSITSRPSGAAGLIEPTGIRIVTPAQVELRRKQNYTVHFELSGYKPQNAYLCRVFSPATHGNLLLGGLIGLSTDMGNGAAWELAPDPLEATLEPDPQHSSDVSVHAPRGAEAPSIHTGAAQ
jgi:hypothetical protein